MLQSLKENLKEQRNKIINAQLTGEKHMRTVNSPFAIGRTDADEIANLQARAELMIAIRDLIEKNNWTQKEAAKNLRTSQPRISNLMNGQVDKFSIGMLIELIEKLGFQFKFTYESEAQSPLAVSVTASAA